MAVLIFLCVNNLSALTLCRLPLPRPVLPSLAMATSSVAVVGEVQELLLVWEEELMRGEEAPTVREEKARVLDIALAKVSVDLDAERAKAKATWKEYLDKMATHTAHAKHTLDLDKMLGEKKVELDGRERHVNLREVTLVEAQNRGLNPWDNRNELMEFVELRRLLQDAEADRIIEAG
jgi:hypothetical protein